MCTKQELFTAIIIYSVETTAIILGNAATIVVFWKRRSQLKRTYFLLINLSVADLLVGVSNIESVAGEILKLRSSNCITSWRNYVVLDMFFESASLNFLVLISLERLYAIAWPLRLRTTSTRKYIYSAGVVWFLSGLVPVFKLLRVFKLIRERTKSWVTSGHSLACLLLILFAYSLIWIYSRKQDPRLPINRQKQNRKLAKTLFIVTLLSLIAWLPFTVVYALRHDIDILSPGSILFDVMQFLQIGNSLINPVVYCFRMPEFRSTLRTMFCRQNYPKLQSRACCQEANAVVLLHVSYLNSTATL